MSIINEINKYIIEYKYIEIYKYTAFLGLFLFLPIRRAKE